MCHFNHHVLSVVTMLTVYKNEYDFFPMVIINGGCVNATKHTVVLDRCPLLRYLLCHLTVSVLFMSLPWAV